MKRLVSSILLFSSIVFGFVRCNNQSQEKTDDTKAADTAAAKAPVNLNWKIGVQTWTFRMFSFEEALKKVDSAGVKNIEAFWGQPLFKGSKASFGADMSADDRAKVKQLLQSHGIQIVAMGVISPRNREEWVKAFDLAKEFGLSYITAEPLKKQWDMVDSLAGQYGVKIAIHDHPRPNAYWSPDSVLAASKGHPNIGACADVGHWARNGLNPVDCLKQLEGHVFGVHLKDIVKFNDTEAADTAVTKGVIDFPAIFQELKRQNFSGMFSIEQESNWYNNVPDVINTVKFFNEQLTKLQQ
jgi:sugar phosphate isomerase/epimerase